MAKATAEMIESIVSSIMNKALPDIMSQVVEKFQGCLDKLLTVFEDKLKDRIDMVHSEMFNSNVRIDTIEKNLAEADKAVSRYKTEMNALKLDIAALEQRLEEQEQYIRRDNLVFHGIGVTVDEDTSDKIWSVCRQYFPSVQIQANDISISHRLPTRSDKTKPIIVRFARRDICQQIYQNNKQLKNTKIMVVEHLTDRRLKLVMKANSLIKSGKLAGTWTMDGKVMIKLQNGTIKPIFNDQDLAGL